MKKPLMISLALCGSMLLGSALGKLMIPTVMIADQQAHFLLKDTVPEAFGEWHVDTSLVPLQVSAEMQAKLDTIYGQTLARTYVNGQGERIMLSLAYGGDQSDYMAVHKPEACYAAQGFEVGEVLPVQLATPYGTIPAKHLLATNGVRSEPITYWIRLGDRTVATGLEQKLRRLSYTLTGKVPDGMLVRVSSISRDEQDAYRLQRAFIDAMLGAMPAENRVRLIGSAGAEP